MFTKLKYTMEATLDGLGLKTLRPKSPPNDGSSNGLSLEQRVSEMEVLKAPGILKYHPTGSYYTCNPPVVDTDEDWVVLVEYRPDTDPEGHLIHHDYYRTNNDYKLCDRNQFRTYRHRENRHNLIVTTNPDWYERFVEATEIAKEENLLRKADRIVLFELIMSKYRSLSRIYYQYNEGDDTSLQNLNSLATFNRYQAMTATRNLQQAMNNQLRQMNDQLRVQPGDMWITRDTPTQWTTIVQVDPAGRR